MLGGLTLAMGGMLTLGSRAAPDWTSKKVLVVYHSRTGHTRTIAEMIQRHTGGDLVEIEPVDPYPEDYDELVTQNVREQQAGYHPPLKTRVDEIGTYDLVFVGSPLWNVRLTPPLRSFLASEAGAQSIRRAHAVQPVTALQSEYSLWHREPEKEIIPLLEELGIALVPFAPLGKGFLTGTVTNEQQFAPDDFRSKQPRFSEENRIANRVFVDVVNAVAARKHSTAAQVALAWLLAQKPWIVPIPGTTKVTRVEENIGAAELTLDGGDLRQIGTALAAVVPQGDRYPPENKAMAGR